ncbi:class I SAM-dependent methyltransferase [Xenorhabdus bovienii]|uniref:Putative Similarities with methyltransferases n=1 Tax=Xenorhabdus bovienii str. Intermedium TaxID=1379677 RepID=A0A077QCN8_XENBV|nr:class I SAM-dependent methyltransferase [Xenorhabdus bovienii]MDE9482102.1 class I SAM-dependent methyltransferase [Xenorhabdus bovienii]MDE9542449.1 class I SAM-dependent methyltransferase [Xenorhabdus bovienii]CDH30900.1 putative Similarities with methyltransferases [Xenorhabdus bovienii str. Intermedium]
MTQHKEKFDGLAKGYDRYRPRYPQVLFREICHWMPKDRSLSIVDIGAGTGIAIEGLASLLGQQHDYTAIDISQDMIDTGKQKLPWVNWLYCSAEQHLSTVRSPDLIMAAQSFQWMNRETVLNLARNSLADNGIMAILQNNRDYQHNEFLNEYENLLEELSPNYSRHYRDFDYVQELNTAFQYEDALHITLNTYWNMFIPGEAFIGMSRSSTQVQRALASHGELFIERLKVLVEKYQSEGKLTISYESQLFMAVK